MKYQIIATEKATNKQFALCANSGVWWFASPTSLCAVTMKMMGAQERIKELEIQELVRMFTTETVCETVNLARFTLSVEPYPYKG